MDIIYDLVGLGTIVALDKKLENDNNEIKFDNFIQQAKEHNILNLKPNCTIKQPGYFFASYDTITDNYIKPAYLKLYDYLVKNNIITKKLKTVSIITWDDVYEVNKESVGEDNLKKIISSKNSDFPPLLTCYHINYKKLSNLLKNYKNSAFDEFNLHVTKGGKRKNIKNKTKRKNKL
jgi:hypothetical protein